jgi:HEAT repeat protein
MAAVLIVSMCCDRAVRAQETPYNERILVENGVGTRKKAVRRAAELAEDEEVQVAALSWLADKEDRKAVPILLGILESSTSPWVRQTAAVGLTRLGEEAGIRALRQQVAAMEAGEEFVPSSAAWLARDLAQAGDAGGYGLVLSFTERPEMRYRTRAMQALVAFIRFPELDALDRLLGLAGDSDPSVRREAVLYIYSACREGAPAERLIATLERLAATDPDPTVRQRAAGTIASMRRTGKSQRGLTCMAH